MRKHAHILFITFSLLTYLLLSQTIAEKLKEANDQLSKLKSVLPPEFLRILDAPPPSTATPDIHFPTSKSTIQTFRTLSRAKFPPDRDHETYATTQSKHGRINQGGTQYVINPSDNVPKQVPWQAAFVSTNQLQYKEELSSGYAAPQMTAAQLQQFARNAQRQREQQKQQQEEDSLRLLEEQRMRENIKANEALREMERAEQERVEGQGVCKPGPISQASSSGSPTVSNVSEIQTQDSRVGQMVEGVSEPVDNTKTSEDIPENELLEIIDQDIQYYDNEVCDMTKCLTTAEVDVDDHSSLPYDLNLVCFNVINNIILERYISKHNIITGTF